jgi:hypothetical protein
MKTMQLSIRLNGAAVGVLEQTPTGKMQFQYLPTANQIISHFNGSAHRETRRTQSPPRAY